MNISKSIRKILDKTAKVLFNIAAVVFGFVMLFNVLTADETVANLLTDNVFKDRPADVTYSTGLEPVRYKTWYSNVDDVLNGNGEIAWLAQSEGTVLLKNEGNALPLSAGDKVSLFGVTAYDPMYCLDGAGNSMINDPEAYEGGSEIYRRQFFYEEFEEAGLVMNETLANWYNSSAGMNYWRRDYVGFNGREGSSRYKGYGGNSNGSLPALTEANWDEIGNNKDQDTFDKQSTTAIYVTGRMSNESADLNPGSSGGVGAWGNNDGDKSGDYLAFTEDEKLLMQALGQNYDKVIVIFNQANPPQDDVPALLQQYGIEAALWIGFPGSDGIKAVADIITGKTNPSGGLSAMWYASREANPSTQNFATNSSGGNNVVNVEGMYVGYRYAETRYEDVLLASDRAGTYDYDTQVSYPFGHGLSYTTFEYSDVNVYPDPDPAKNYYSGGLMAANDENYAGYYGTAVADEAMRATGAALGDCDDLIMEVTVTNTGSVAGKEIVQVYLQQPVSDTDEAHHVEKPSVQLIGYGKTDILERGESETLEIEIDANKWFASYDDDLQDADGNVVGGYVLSQGNYYLTAARNSHEAVNSIYKATHTGELPAAFDDEYGAGDAGNVATVNVSAARSNSYRYWTQGTTDDVHNLFDDVNPNKAGGSNDVTFLSRYDWQTTAAAGEGGFIGQRATSSYGSARGKTGGFDHDDTLSVAEIDAYEEYYGVQYDDTVYTYGWNSGKLNTEEELQLIDLIGVEYDPARGASEEDVAKWEALLGEMTSSDFQRLFSQGLRKTLSVESIGKPGTNDQNASNGFEWPFSYDGSFNSKNADYGFRLRFDPDSPNCYPTGYPCEGIRAATFNNEIAYLVGQAMGEDALWGGTSGIYGFGLGLQRNPYHGRAGEFYSDDSFLTGMIGGYETKGAQSKGLYVYNKHFVLNDQETNRSSYSAWLDEQTFRQIYLRPFEMAIEIGDAMNVMIAFNELGDSWTGSNYNLMTRWLRGEAGMAGFALSDWYYSEGENLGFGVLAGSCLLDGNGNGGYSAGVDARYDNRLVEAATRILYTVANSNAMNFWGEGTETHSFDPLWYTTRTNVVTAVSIIFGVCCAFLLGTTAWTITADILESRKTKK